MAIPATELVSAVIGKLEIDSAKVADIARFQIYENLSEAQLHLMNVLPIQFLSEGIKTVLFPTELNEAEYQWPTVDFPFLRYVALWIDYTTAIIMTGATPNPGQRVIEYDGDIHHVSVNDIATKTYPFIDLNVEVGYMIYPVPDLAVTDGGRLRYIYKPADISLTQDSLLNPGLKNLLIFMATSLSAMVDNYRPELAVKYNQMFEAELKLILPKDEVKQ